MTSPQLSLLGPTEVQAVMPGLYMCAFHEDRLAVALVNVGAFWEGRCKACVAKGEKK